VKVYILSILLFFSISSFSQTKSVRELALELSIRDLKMSELVNITNDKFSDSIDKAKFIYYWIGFNIKYDYKLLEPKSTLREKQNAYSYNFYPGQIFVKKMAVCYGYSKLYEWFMNKLGIESTIISGFIRDERNHYVELDSDSEFSHAWNAIKLNGKWRLVDSTWGTSLNEGVADFYFDMPPERAIISHYPKNSTWQLLKKPLSLKEFNNSKFINPIWFKIGYSDIPQMKMDSNYYYFVFKNNPNEDWLVNLMYSVDNKDFYNLREVKTIIQDEYTILRFYKSIIPKKTFFKVNLYKSIDNIDYSLIHSDVINFKM